MELSTRHSRLFIISSIFLLALVVDGGNCRIIKTGPPPPRSDSTLELLHVLIRHGPRTPVNTYPNDPYINDTFFPNGWGHLTNKGKLELFKIGTWLRKRYQNLLQPYYSPDLVHAESSNSPRTMMSLSTVLASLFAPKNTPMEWNTQLNWQPIPIYVESNDIMLRMTATCPRYDEALKEVLQLPEVLAELSDHQVLFDELSTITGMNVTGANDINSLYITLLAEQAFGLTLPDWTKDYYPEKLQFLAEQNYVYNAYTPEMQKIKAGPFLKQIFQQMQDKASGTLSPKQRKAFMYCAHDWSVTNILSALKVWKRQMPGFSSTILIELHKNQNTGAHYVEIYLRNNANEDVQKLTVPGCDFQCPLERLIELNKDVIPDQTHEEMCQAKGPQ